MTDKWTEACKKWEVWAVKRDFDEFLFTVEWPAKKKKKFE